MAGMRFKMPHLSENIITGVDGRQWLRDKTGRGRNERLYLLSDGTYTTVSEVCKKTNLPAPTVRLRLYKSNDIDRVYSQRHAKKSTWKTHVKLEKKKQRIEDPMVKLMLSFK